MSSASSINDALANYAAGKLTAQELVGVVAAEYYRGDGRRETLRPVMDVIERAHPGIVELSSSDHQPGFAVKLAARPFPKQWEPALRTAAASIRDRESNVAPPPSPGLFRRIIRAIRKIFSA
jgi:hypothetical protein